MKNDELAFMATEFMQIPHYSWNMEYFFKCDQLLSDMGSWVDSISEDVEIDEDFLCTCEQFENYVNRVEEYVHRKNVICILIEELNIPTEVAFKICEYATYQYGIEFGLHVEGQFLGDDLECAVEFAHLKDKYMVEFWALDESAKELGLESSVIIRIRKNGGK